MQNFCDDGNNHTNDGCSATCTVECGYTCDSGLADAFDTCTTTCGNAVKTDDEACDDGNTANNDGCSSTCTEEEGYTCAELDICSPSTCSEVCGDGKHVGDEACDDGNTVSEDGCSAQCAVETACGYSCGGGSLTTPDTCAATACGDGIRASDEVCDDGNTADGDGCNSTCGTESGWNCTSAVACGPSSCVASYICEHGWTGASCNQPDAACEDGFSGIECQACEEDTYSEGCSAPCDTKLNCSGNGRWVPAHLCTCVFCRSSLFVWQAVYFSACLPLLPRFLGGDTLLVSISRCFRWRSRHVACSFLCRCQCGTLFLTIAC